VKTLASVPLLYIKAGLFVIAGFVAASLLVLRHRDLQAVVLVAIAVWAFCRAYYFAFYVVERYADPGYRFSGLTSFVRYVARRRRAEKRPPKSVSSAFERVGKQSHSSGLASAAGETFVRREQ
jgi:hypothetical protein